MNAEAHPGHGDARSGAVLRVGCPQWAQRSWVGRFWPRTKASEELFAYSRALTAVEGNTTFYASPAPSTVARWAELAHPDFRFVFKAPQEITHERRLRDVDALLAAFVALLAPLSDRVGGITLQLPASFGPTDLDAIDAVLARASRAVRFSVEVRHPAFFDDAGAAALARVLVRHGAEQVLLDSTALFSRAPRTPAGEEAWRKKPRVPRRQHAHTAHPIVRFIGSDHDDVTAEGLASWHEPLAAWLREGRAPTFFVHTPDNEESPGLCQAFHAELRRRLPALPPLPTPAPAAPSGPVQGSLF